MPVLLNKMSSYEIVSLLLWQIKLFRLEVSGLQELKEDFEILGIDPEQAFLLAEKKQLEALKILAEKIKIGDWVWKPARLVALGYKKRVFGDKENGRIN